MDIVIGGIRSTNPIFVVSRADQRLLLGQPFIRNTWLSQSPREDGMYATIWNTDRTKSVEARVATWDDTANWYQKDIFLETKGWFHEGTWSRQQDECP